MRLSSRNFQLQSKHLTVTLSSEGSNNPSSTCTVVVSVTDLNDVPPMFTRTPRGNVIDVRNDAPVGEVVGTVAAADSDGTAPGNVVRYAATERGSSDRATKYFAVDEETGDISIADDLTQELYDEYRVRPALLMLETFQMRSLRIRSIMF